MSSHDCLSGAKCRDACATVVDSDGIRHPAKTEQPDSLCPACDASITSAIRQLPRDWADLHKAIGDRDRSDGPKTSSTPTAVILINTRREALMAAIVDTVDRAAAIVSDALGADQPTGRRRPPADAEEGSLAWTAAENRHPVDAQKIRAAIAMVEPNIDLLAAAVEQPAMVWKTPRRCTTHAHMIGSAETMLALTLRMDDIGDASIKQIRAFLRERLRKPIPDTAIQFRDKLKAAFRAAGHCEDCGGWCATGQAWTLIDMTGVDIAFQLVDLHHQTRAELGKTRLRHRYAMPCPRCGGRVGRDDGETVITCDNQTTCKSSWTDREYKYLTGLVIYERQDVDIAKWLLAEAYWRLDQVQRRVDIARATGATLTLPGSGAIIADSISDVLHGHKAPADRAISSAKTVAEQRQDDDDAWKWGDRPTAYKPPKPKRKRVIATRATGPVKPVHPSSRSTLIDIDIAVVTGLVCPECNLVHAGACA